MELTKDPYLEKLRPNGQVLGQRQSKVLGFEDLPTLRQTHRDKKIVQCHGVFDVLHAGHLAYFEKAKEQGDLLVITVTSDEYVNKGPGRPYFTTGIRKSMLASLEVVDYVVTSPYPTAVPSIEALRPDYYVKGPDYRNKAKDPTGAIYLEEQAAERGGGRLTFTSEETYSSSHLINEFFPTWNDDQQEAIRKVKEMGGMDLIESVLERLSECKVLIVGEPIIDRYVFCTPESISSKGPCVSAKYLYHEDYAGGSMAIANHLSDFVKSTKLATTHGGESHFNELVKERLDSRIQFLAQELAGVPTPKKTRYIAENEIQRVFELTTLRSDQWKNHSPREFCDLIAKESRAVDCSIIADFGHGLFEGPVLETAGTIDGFVGLNVQTNSSNYGFNPYTKHRRFSFLSIDTREVRIAYHDRFSSPLDLARKLRKDLSPIGASVALTVGPSGAYFFPYDEKTHEEIKVPAYADQVVDPTGAGDAFFALSALLVKVGCPNYLVPFLGNIFAGLKTKTIGNKSAVSKAQLVKAVTAILK